MEKRDSLPGFNRHQDRKDLLKDFNCVVIVFSCEGLGIPTFPLSVDRTFTYPEFASKRPGFDKQEAPFWGRN